MTVQIDSNRRAGRNITSVVYDEAGNIGSMPNLVGGFISIMVGTQLLNEFTKTTKIIIPPEDNNREEEKFYTKLCAKARGEITVKVTKK